jgi:hypothetical protein
LFMVLVSAARKNRSLWVGMALRAVRAGMVR